MDAVASEFKVTYYVGVMLAQGGVLMIRDNGVLFAPRALERAMGAVDISIPFDEIKMAEVSGTITESLLVRTSQKVHRFVGSDLYKILDVINSSLQAYKQFKASQPKSAQETGKGAETGSEIKPELARGESPDSGQKPASQGRCPSCLKPVRTDFNFCPFCKAPIKNVCPSCRQRLESDWKFCAFCGHSARAEIV